MASQTFLGNDPGASEHGNFINYYKFHPAKDRLTTYPTDVWWINQETKYSCLDVGCNSGELTQALWEFITDNLKSKTTELEVNQISSSPCQRTKDGVACAMLGIDVDKMLVSRAEEANNRKDLIKYAFCDIMNEVDVREVVSNYFCDSSRELGCGCKFDAVFLLSVTMWIHLNHGDEGLRRLLLRATQFSKNLIVIEPQLWKCYAAAKRRCIRAGGKGFPQLDGIKVRGDTAIENEVNCILTEAGFKKIYETDKSMWKRKTLFYQKCL